MEEFHLSEAEFTKQSLQNFSDLFPDEAACLRLFPAVCRACGLNNETESTRCFVCSKCKTKTWRTAGTYFHGLQKLMPTVAWIWLHEDRAIMSVNRFSEIFKIAYATAWEIDARMKDVLEKEMDRHDAFEVISRVFDSVICKRSDQSLPGQHPNFEEDDEQPEPEDQEEMDSDQRAIYVLLTSQPAEYDDLYRDSKLPIDKFASALAMLDMNDVVERYSGNRFALKKTNPIALVSGKELQTVHDFFKFVEHVHGVSRKYLQRHLASFWSHWGRNRWCRQTLLKTCMKYARLSRAELLAYNSPKMLRIPVPI